MKLKVGDRVKFNETGLMDVFGVKHLNIGAFTITKVSKNSKTNDYPTYMVKVDNPEINKFMLLDIYFTPIDWT
jgi:hypothetical protein